MVTIQDFIDRLENYWVSLVSTTNGTIEKHWLVALMQIHDYSLGHFTQISHLIKVGDMALH